jgi:hypothetical protein
MRRGIAGHHVERRGSIARWYLLAGVALLLGLHDPAAVARASEPATTQRARGSEKQGLRVGWAMADITPPKPASMRGFFSKRVSTGVRDRLTATALALEGPGPDGVAEQAILVSCDLCGIAKATQEAVRRLVKGRVVDFDVGTLVLHATHTHQGPYEKSGYFGGEHDITPQEQAKGAMTGHEYAALLADRLAEAAVHAWMSRKPNGMSWALEHAAVGFNRRFVYSDGTAKMLRPINTPDFDCVEGVEDHGLGLLFFWDEQGRLTGVVINVACPAQTDQGGTLISADFWTDVREEMAARHKGVFIHPECGAAGDIYPKAMFRRRAEEAMAKRRGISWRREIALRIVEGIERALPAARSDVAKDPVFRHAVVQMNLPTQPPSVRPAYTCDPVDPVECHVMRLGDVAIATNPFELFTDYGIRIQARSKATMTLNVQLAGQCSGYLPSARAIRGGGYSADKYLVGPDGGRILVDRTVEGINVLYSGSK